MMKFIRRNLWLRVVVLIGSGIIMMDGLPTSVFGLHQ
jgi:hypothetical protein